MNGFFNPFAGGAGGGSGTDYNNLTNKPTINGITVQGSLTTGDLLITAADVGALPSGTKYGADFALTIDSQTFIVTAQLKDQDGNNLGQAKTIDLPLETMVVGGRYDDTTQKVILTLKNGQTVEFSVADLISGLQSEITLSNKLDADLVSDVSSENKFVTAAEKTAWNAKANASDVYTKSQTDTAIETAIGTLDVTSVGGSGKYISAISETNGKIEATAETMDTTPTANSTVPVTSGGVAASQAAQDAEIAWNVNHGVKNLLRFDLESVKALNGGTWSGNANTINGVTITVNDTDKTISFVKTASGGDIYFRLTTALQSILSSGSKYILSGATGGSSTTFYLGNSGNWENMNGDTEITYTGSFASIYVCVKSTMPLNTTITIKPMIRPASITDSTFQPYALPNPVITPAVIKAVDEGAKNNLYFNSIGNAGSAWSNPYTHNGITYTFLADGAISAYGTASSTENSFCYLGLNNVKVNIDELCDGSHVLAGCPSGGSTSTWRMYVTKSRYGNYSDTGTGVLLPDKSTYSGILVCAFVSKGVTIPQNSPIVFKPMICTAADWAVSQKFVTYCPTNRELYEMIGNINTILQGVL